MNPQDFVLDKSPNDKPYEHDSVVYDEFGISQIRCACCGAQVGGRSYTTLYSKQDISKFIDAAVFILHANYCRKEVHLSNGTVARIAHCIECVDKPVHLEHATVQMKRGWMKENIHARHSPEMLATHHEKVKTLKITKDALKVHIPWKKKEIKNGRR